METKNALSVYVVDDDPMFLQSIKHSLQDKWKEKIKVKVFSTGEEFLKHGQDEKPDIVFLDYFLNGLNPFAMDGSSVLKKIQQTNPNMKVIILSAQNKIEVALESIKNGAFDYVIKNENTFFKIQNSIKDIMKMKSEQVRMKIYKWWIFLALLSAGGAVFAIVLMKVVLT